ncbi:hypothetical protein [Kitasatospora sp. NBC_01302]|uniref:hypothetical protein n=1 Tax=Kitasatospora sp. NBC_01302 TaxID=2903575 RepID=UPI002E14BF6A|nr:hypothetical protein OG294_14045 [Kitasatospora sp. NBC_01302]
MNTTVDQVHALFAKLTLPVLTDTESGDEGFHARTQAGRDTVEVRYQFGFYQTMEAADLAASPQLRADFQRAVNAAPQYGYTVTWKPRTALMHVTRTDN